MTAANYPECESHVLASEGGYTNHPKDPGGATNWGITLADARRYWKSSATAADVKAMPRSVAEGIYRQKYWNALACDRLPSGLDYTLFDYGVNSGIGRAGKVLRRVLGLADNTYAVSDQVLAAIAKRDVAKIIAAINAERLRFLQSLKTWPTFGGGWGARVQSVNSISLHMAAHPGAVPLPSPPISEAKGVVPPPKVAKAVLKTGGALAPAAAAHPSSHLWIAEHPYEAGAIALAGVVIVGGGVWALEHWHRTKQEAPTPGLVPVPVAA